MGDVFQRDTGALPAASSVVMARAPRDMPWKQPIRANTLVRPVTLRASFRAASMALVPVGPGNMILKSSPRGLRTWVSKNSMNSPLVSVYISMEWMMPFPVR